MRLDVALYPGQAQAAQLILDPNKRTDVMMACGVGGGKTHTLCAVAVALAHMNPPGVHGMLVEPTFRMIEDVLIPSLEEFLDDHGVSYEYQAGKMSYHLPTSGNSIILRSGEKPHRLRGANLAWAGQDEAAYQHPDTRQVLLSRLRHPKARKRVLFGATTPSGFNWVYGAFADPMRVNTKDTALVTWPTWENRAVMDSDPDFVERLRRAYSKELFAQEVEGKFLVVGKGRTYYEFDRTKHLRDFELDPALPLDLCVDFNVAPAVWVVAQGKATKRLPERAIDEITASGDRSTYQALEEFQARYPQYASGRNVRIFGDASGSARQTTGYTDFEVIRSILPHAEVNVRHRNPSVKDRTNSVNAILRAKVCYIHSTRCPRLLRDLEQVRNLEDSFQIDKSNKELTHPSDAFGYKIQWSYPIQVRKSAA